MKTLCKKSMILTVPNISAANSVKEFNKGELYEYDAFFFPPDGFAKGGSYLVYDVENNYISEKDFNDYFFSHEETLNIKRAELIDKMLNEESD